MKCRAVTVNDDTALRGIADLYSSVFPRRTLPIREIKGWIAKFSRAVSVLEDNKRVWGFWRCLPITETIHNAIRFSEEDSRSYLTPESTLSDAEVDNNVVEGIGNFCSVAMVAVDPEKNIESYEGEALCLFENLETLFRRIRVRAIVCQSETTIEDKALATVGCARARVLRATPECHRSIWYFNEDCIPGQPLSQLSSLYHQLWLTEQRFDITRRQRQVLACRVTLDLGEKEAASFLGITPDAVRQSCKKIRDKLNADDKNRIFLNTDDLLQYCRDNPIELKVPLLLPQSGELEQ